MARKGESPQKRQDALIALASARAKGATIREFANFFSSSRAGPPVTPGNLTVGTAAAIDLFTVLIPPLDPAGDMVELFALLNFTLSAPDTVALGITIAPNGVVTGGGFVDNGIQYETGQGAGQALVVTSGAPSPMWAYNEDLAAGFRTIVLAGYVKLPPPAPGTNSLIRAKIGAAGGATFTVMSLSVHGRTVFPLGV